MLDFPRKWIQFNDQKVPIKYLSPVWRSHTWPIFSYNELGLIVPRFAHFFRAGAENVEQNFCQESMAWREKLGIKQDGCREVKGINWNDLDNPVGCELCLLTFEEP